MTIHNVILREIPSICEKHFLNEEFHFVALVVNTAIIVFKLGILFCVFVEYLLKGQFSHYVVK